MDANKWYRDYSFDFHVYRVGKYVLLEVDIDNSVCFQFPSLSKEKRRMCFGYFTSGLVLVGYCTSAVAAQALQRAVPDFQLSFIRFAVQMAMSAVFLRLTKTRIDLSYDSVDIVISICFTSLLYNILFFHAIAILPLTDAYGLFTLLSTLALALLTKVYQRIDLGLLHHASITLAAFGCILIIQPWGHFQKGFIPTFIKESFNMSELFQDDNSTIQVNDHLPRGMNIGGILVLGYILVTLAAGNEAVALMILGRASAINPLVLSLLVSSISALPSLLMSFYLEIPVLISNPQTVALVLIHALGVAMGAIATNYACTSIAPSRVSLVQSFSIIILLVVQYTVMKNGLFGRMNVLEVGGCLVITISIIISIVPTFCHNQSTDLDC